MRKLFNIAASSIVWIATIVAPVALYAQPDPPGGPVPIDGGIGLLIAAGAAYGAKKMKSNRIND
ncbi:MAG: PID-CTERM protein-sorting domain-containing protein [Thermaurantimonas sp.]|uniref:PID-CTERM protein-sorting domain-containing protein n=1 Tax=Thermaurantimonas sp. TaxID=2681568 RepID=UPI00391A0FCE